jgi:hypothetical protein
MAEGKKSDPTISTASIDKTQYPEGTHPARPASEVTHSATNITYKDNPDKPDPTTVAQIAEIPENFPGQGAPKE